MWKTAGCTQQGRLHCGVACIIASKGRSRSTAAKGFGIRSRVDPKPHAFSPGSETPTEVSLGIGYRAHSTSAAAAAAAAGHSTGLACTDSKATTHRGKQKHRGPGNQCSEGAGWPGGQWRQLTHIAQEDVVEAWAELTISGWQLLWQGFTEINGTKCKPQCLKTMRCLTGSLRGYSTGPC